MSKKIKIEISTLLKALVENNIDDYFKKNLFKIKYKIAQDIIIELTKNVNREISAKDIKIKVINRINHE